MPTKNRTVVFFEGTPGKQGATERFFCNDYYPFGLPISGTRYQEPGTGTPTDKTNRFLYQGKEWQTALALNPYNFHSRHGSTLRNDPTTGSYFGSRGIVNWAMNGAELSRDGLNNIWTEVNRAKRQALSRLAG